MLRIAVTGVAGFLGSHLADKYIQGGHSVIGIDNLIGGYRSNVPLNVEFHEIDLLNLKLVKSVLSDVDIVVHAACTAYEGLSVFSPSLVVANTVQATTNVMSAAASNGVKKVIFMSSMARYGTQVKIPFTEDLTPAPQDPYGIAKFSSELLVRNLSDVHGLKYVILVPHNIIGPRQKYDDPYRNVASIMINRMIQGKQPIIYGDGSQRRCFSFIDDVIDPLVTATFSLNAESQTINIGPDEEFISINELAEEIASILDFRLEPIYMPGRPQEVVDANCSAELARRILGYETRVSLRDGLKDLALWIQSQGAKPFDYHLPLEIISDSTPRTWKERLI